MASVILEEQGGQSSCDRLIGQSEQINGNMSTREVVLLPVHR